MILFKLNTGENILLDVNYNVFNSGNDITERPEKCHFVYFNWVKVSDLIDSRIPENYKKEHGDEMRVEFSFHQVSKPPSSFSDFTIRINNIVYFGKVQSDSELAQVFDQYKKEMNIIY